MGVRKAEVDYSKSTMAYPMATEPTPRFVDSDIDYSASTGAYPMHDARSVNTLVERVVEHIDAPVEPQFETPGPISAGMEDAVAEQRAELGLSADPSGESDAGYEARPSTLPVPGADGVDREPEVKVIAPPPRPQVRRGRRATGK